MAASICLNCEKIDQSEDEPCCDAPDLITMDGMPAEIKRLRGAVVAAAAARGSVQDAVDIVRTEEALRWSHRVNTLQARLRWADDRYMRLLKEVADTIAMQPRPVMIDLGDADRGRVGCGVAPGGAAAPNPEVEEAACYRWLRDNWGQIAVETILGAPRAVKAVELLPTLQPVDPKSLHRAILRAMSKEAPSC